MSSTSLHEATKDLSAETREMHRAIVSLIEELEAVDWYGQRVDAVRDDALAEILAHNRDEEKEHACMTLEWIRRRDPDFDRMLRRFLFTDGPIVAVEHDERGGDADESASASNDQSASDASRDVSLGIGSLRGQASRHAASKGGSS